MRRRNVNDNSWPSWRYGPYGESAIFNSEAEVPHGWTKKPGEIYIAPTNTQLDRDDLIKQLTEQGILIDPTWGRAQMKKVLDDSSTSR